MWCTTTSSAMFYLPLHGDPLTSVCFGSSTEWIVCASINAICIHWLEVPSVTDMISMWLDNSKPQQDSEDLTVQLIASHPSLPSKKVRLLAPLIACCP